MMPTVRPVAAIHTVALFYLGVIKIVTLTAIDIVQMLFIVLKNWGWVARHLPQFFFKELIGDLHLNFW